MYYNILLHTTIYYSALQYITMYYNIPVLAAGAGDREVGGCIKRLLSPLPPCSFLSLCFSFLSPSPSPLFFFCFCPCSVPCVLPMRSCFTKRYKNNGLVKHDFSKRCKNNGLVKMRFTKPLFL